MPHAEDPPLAIEEVDVQLEAHPEGVDAGATREQQAGAGLGAAAEGEAPQAGSKTLCNGDPGEKMIHSPTSQTGTPISPRRPPGR